jgi:F0F1-type ATP synthase assembly protein I
VLGPGGGKQFKAFARMGALGIELAVATVIGLLAGRWLDGKLGTDPYLTLVGLLLGVAAGFKSLFETARRQQREDQSSEAPPKDESP